MDSESIGIIAGFWANYGDFILVLGRRVLVSIIIIISGKITASIFKKLLHGALSEKLKTDENLTSLFKIVINYGIVIICLIMILDVFEINTTGLIALLGAAGVAIGFSLKDTLSNIAAGIVIFILRPFYVGDFIECGSITGAVREIKLFTTYMETGDGIFISAPNSNFWGVPLKNFSRNARRRMDITVFISFSESIDRAFQVLNSIIQEETRFLNDPAPQVMVQSLGEQGIGITLRAWASAGQYWAVYWDQMKNVNDKFQEAGIALAIPRREVHLMGSK